MRQDLIQPVSPTIAELVPDTLEVDLDKIALGISKPSEGSTLFFFGLAIDTPPVDLANLPIIHNVLSTQERLALQKLQILIASAPIAQELAAEINKLIDNHYPQVPTKGMDTPINLGLQLQVGQDSTSLLFDIGTDSQASNRNNTVSQPTSLVVPTQPDRTLLQSTAQGVKWLSLQKNFGPLYFDKIGLQYSNAQLLVLLNVSATASALTLSLEGFGVSTPIKNFKPSFTLDGVGITYASGPVEIGGELQGSFAAMELTGEVVIKTETLAIAGLGGYPTVNNHPAMFLYAVLDYPIGGPAFFFVTGLAAGFGFNHTLLLPAINGVANFPFVRWAQGQDNPPIPDPNQDIGDQVHQVLEGLVEQGIVAPGLGHDWLAAGIQFTSFEMLDSFALLTVIFGTDVEIALLGLSTLSLPVGAKHPVAYAELALQASFSTKSELLAIQGQLTNSSYVFSKDCHLIGGFAFYAWFSEEHAGDFVITLGGYNPNYPVPARYPTVSRLGINWQVTGQLVIKGREYFALTSNAIMAGGFLEAVWHIGEALQEMNAHPATTPVCGWILPNQLTESLFFYDQQGKALGTMFLNGDQSAIQWQSAPGDDTTINQPVEAIFQDQNPQLRALAMALYNGTPNYFKAFWRAIDRMQNFATSSHLALLIGRPIAITQACIGLELQGSPACNQSYKAIQEEKYAYDNHFTQVRFPVILGDLSQVNDGLIGYFKTNAQGYDWTTFYSEAAEGTDAGVIKPPATNLILTAFPKAAAPAPTDNTAYLQKVLMLVDPRAKIYATTGILPTKAIEIPSDQYAAILKTLEMTFFMSPILKGASRLAMPLPTEAGYTRSWIAETAKEQKTAWQVDPVITPAVGQAIAGYTPQTIREGWLRLNPNLLNFELLNQSGQPVAKPHAPNILVLNMTNKKGNPITMPPGQLTHEGSTHTGAVFYIHFGRLVPDEEIPNITMQAANWAFKCLSDPQYGSYWAATPTQSVTLANNKSIAFTLSNLITADRTGQVQLCIDYYGFQGLNDGTQAIFITLSATN